ncbi:Uncharacterized protein PBTT_00237 [Plasmodiophora brassicae]|uniref:Uncharacterized protein n=1 Tax=Plasmodiophora brassicae TaxID=37360 RepID=A0A0G4J4I0_PLABS|nr:hypothetical protein PBRA_002529 [Plasmodiophora brassicae]SPQ93556.1 unnamed protein product [Plasmodiophora brassicae]
MTSRAGEGVNEAGVPSGSAAGHRIPIHLLLSTDLVVDTASKACEVQQACAQQMHVEQNDVVIYRLVPVDASEGIVPGTNIQDELAFVVRGRQELCVRSIERTMTENRHLEHNLKRATAALMTISNAREDARDDKAYGSLEDRVRQLESELCSARSALEQYRQWRIASRINMDALKNEFQQLQQALKDYQ